MDGQKPEETQNSSATQLMPGDTIRPQQEAQPAPANAEQAQTTTQPQVPVAQAEQPLPAATNEPPQYSYTDQSTTNYDEVDPPYGADDSAVTWTASEFVAHQKTSGWYISLLLLTCAASAAVWVVTKDIVSSVVIVFAGVVLAAYAARKPRQLQYQIDASGLTIDQRHYDYNQFKSFSVVPEGAFSSIVFAPLKRFGTLLTIYYDPQDEERIVTAIGARLPHEERRPDLVDGMMKRIRF